MALPRRALRALARRFWSKVDRAGGPNACWFWTAGKNTWGYGYFRTNGKMERAHRVAFALGDPSDVEREEDGLVGRIGPRDIPAGRYVLHLCDVRACVNPGHLYLGTLSDNLKDEYARFRRPAKPFAALAANIARRLGLKPRKKAA